MKKIRCAIYTRKSSEEGLDQAFNSLDAQREACAAYIASQKHEGWVLLPNRYDDGGLSGGTLDRPALQELMREVDDKKVDQIVVYKIDRLTRSLADFAKLVERLDAANVAFVSVTQSFNTATSMGRLTLNMLLSFAQFEREVTAERIRDKIAASKKKGMWMGGNVPLGYDADGRTLKINPSEASTIRTLFDIYLKYGTIRSMKEQVDRLGFRTKPGGKSFGRGHLHYILTNPLYIGRIRHHSLTYEGQHPAIIDNETWDAVQKRLIDAAARSRGKANSGAHTSLLAGKLRDETGDKLTPSHTNRDGRRYRYYVSNRLMTRPGKEAPNDGTGWRLPAFELESRISNTIADRLRKELCGKLLVDSTADIIRIAQSKLDNVTAEDRDFRKTVLQDCLASATIQPGELEIRLEVDGTAKLLQIEPTHLNQMALCFKSAFRFRKRGVESRLVIGGDTPPDIDPVLVRNIARAHHYYAELKNGRRFDEIAVSANISKRRLLQVLGMAFIAPDIVRTIVDGRQPTGLTSDWLQRNSLPLDWDAQRRLVAVL